MVSATGFNVRSHSACIALSSMVGMPNGRFLPLLLGMYTRRNGSGWYPLCVSDCDAFNLDIGVAQILPSTPAVLFPAFSVTRLTARSLPLCERVSRCCKAWTLFYLPACMALAIRACSRVTSCVTSSQLIWSQLS